MKEHSFYCPIAFEDGWLYRFPNGELMFLPKQGPAIHYQVKPPKSEEKKKK